MSVLNISNDVYEAPNGDDVVVSIFIDGDFVHILDKDREECTSLTKAVSDEWLKHIIDSYRLSLPRRRFPIRKFENYRILLYHSDGTITEWVDGCSKQCLDIDIVHKPYFDVSIDRLKELEKE